MVAFRKPVKTESLIDQLNYWRNIRMDFPGRKAEAMANIDRILDEMEADSGTEAG